MKKRLFAILLCACGAVGCSDAPEPTGAEDRACWLSEMLRISDPVLRHAAAGTLKETMPYESPDTEQKRRDFSYLEALGRTLCGMGPWLELEGERDPRQAEYRDLARRALTNAVDPASPDYMAFDHGRQPLVDAAYLAEGVLRAKRQLWEELGDEAIYGYTKIYRK